MMSTLLLLVAVSNAQNPVIATFSPLSAGPGATVIIAGSNLTGATGVSFGGVPAASYTVVSSSAITAVVGYGASGSISVTTASGTGSLAGFTYVAPPPTITSFSPTSGPVGTTVTINGTNFNTTAASNIVYFGAVSATVLTATNTKLTVTVPVGATYQPISVTNANQSAYAAKPFVVTFSGGGTAFNANTFSSKVDFTTTSTPMMSSIADMDGDGKSDIVVSNQYGYTFSIFRNTSTSVGSVSFANKTDITTTYYYNYGNCIADIDGDGKLDVLSTNYSYNMFAVYRNTSTVGNISMAPEVNIATGTYPNFIRASDIDGDGKPDLVVGYSTGTIISVYLNTSTAGNIAFGARTDYAVGSTPSTVAIADIDGDGKKDIVTCNQSSNTVSILRNTSTGAGSLAFATKADYSTGTNPRYIAIGDMDGDGKLDLVVANYSSLSVSVLRNLSVSGTVALSTKVDFSTGSGMYPGSIALGDIDGDGKVDIAAGNANGTTYSIFRNTSVSGSITTSSFSTVYNNIAGTNPANICLGDVDGDGKSDLLVANVGGTSISLFRNQIGGPIVTSFTPNSGVSGTSVIISGTNFTGATGVTIGGVACASYTVVSATAIIAIVGNGASGSVAVTTPTGVGSLGGFYYTIPIPVISSFTPTNGPVGTSVTITGTNFSTTAANNTVYFGAAKATVTAATATSLTVTVPVGATYQPISVTNNNLTANSLKPFIVTFTGGSASFLTGSFATKSDYIVNTNPSIVTISDLDGDGKSDLITANGYYNTLSILKNTTKSGNVSFASKVDITTNGQAMGVCVVDLDGDGKPDVATTNYNNNALSVFKNNSKVDSILLSTETDYPSGSYPYFVTSGDFDGDGKPDLIVANYSSYTISVFRNLSTVGNIQFDTKIDLAAGYYPVFLAANDIDGDGKVDIVSADQSSNTVSVYRNTSTGYGSIAFATRTAFATGSSPRSVAVGDIDGDGKADIVVANSTDATVSVLRNTSTSGAVSFASKSDYTAGSGSGTSCVTLNDLDGDGKIDIAVTGQSTNVVAVLRNKSTSGTVSLETNVNYTVGVYPSGLMSGDFDGDGKPDIVVANTNSATVSLLRNKMGEPVISSFSPTNGVAGTTVIINGANFNNVTAVTFGGTPALSFTVVSSAAIVATVDSGSSGNVAVVAAAGTAILGGFSYVSPVPSITSFSPTSGVIGSTVTITGANFGNTPAKNIVYFGAVKATISAATSSSLTVTVPVGATYQPISVTTNGLTTNSAIPFNVKFPGGGASFTSSLFSTHSDSSVGTNPRSVALADFDGDGKSDFIYTNSNSPGNVTVLKNTSKGKIIAFTTGIGYSNLNYPIGLAIADIDGDGKLDFAIANYYNNTVAIYRNSSTNGNITFDPEIDITTVSNPLYLSLGDLDNDGRPDLVVSGNYQSSIISVLRNTSSIGNIAFATNVDYTTGSYPTVPLIADLNGDGLMDVAVANYYSSSISVLKNISTFGSISLASKTDYTSPGSPETLAVGDFDGDGKPDLVLSNYSNTTISVYRNLYANSGDNFTASTFSARTDFTVGSSGYGVAVSDLDGDGKPDIAVCNSSSSSISLLRNKSTTGSISFDPKLDLATGSQPLYLAVGDIDGDNKPDIVTSNYSGSSLSILRNQLGDPVISAFTPNSGGPLSTVVISGSGFNNVTAVSFGGVPASSYMVISSTAIIAYVGYGASGIVNVTTATGSADIDGFTYTPPPPTINSFTPANASSGTTVTISGINFGGATSVSFGGIPASSYNVVNATTITAVVGTGATGNISVITAGGNSNIAGFVYCTPASTLSAKINGCGSVVYKGVTYTSNTTFTDTIKAVKGCDSVYKVTTINIITPVTNTQSLSGCNSVVYKGTTYINSTSIRDTIKSTQGCDSLYNQVSITINKLIAITQNAFVSGCNSVVFNGTTYTTSTTKNDTIRGVQGCDSIYKVTTISVTKITPTTQNIKVGGCNSVVYNGITYLNSTTKTDTIKSTQGCDSIYKVATITVSKITPAIQSNPLSGCNKVIYNSITYTSNTIVKDTIKSTLGCDSVYKTTTITVYNLVPVTNNVSLSGCNSIVYNGTTYTSSTVKRDTIRGAYGCDSIYKVATITVTKITASSQALQFSGCNKVVYNGITYTNSTIVKDTIKSIQGCDSIYKTATITVSKITPTTQNISFSGCNKVVYNGNNYTSSNIVKDTIKSVQGCDSIYKTATITVFNITSIINNISVQGCNSVVYNGNTYTNSTTKNDTIRSVKGCDSIYKIASIVVTKITATTLSNSFTGCDSVIYNQTKYYTSTVLHDTIKSVQGCDSIYNVVTITVKPTPVILNVSSNSPVVIGDTIKLYATGSSGTLYSWTGPLSYTSTTQNAVIANAATTMAGSYAVTVTNNGCTSAAVSTQVVIANATYTVSGRVWHPKGFYVKDINVSLSGGEGLTTTTDNGGNYSFKQIAGANFKVNGVTFGRNTLSLRNKDRGEVTTVDLALIQSHILQKNLLNSPYKLIAADVNNDSKISTLDIVFMKRIILGLDTSYTGNKLWALIDSSYTFTNPLIPFPHKDSIKYSNLSSNQISQTFTGVILGDVNWSATSPKTQMGSTIELYYDNISTANQEIIKVPIRVKNFRDMMGMQFTLNFNPDAMKFVGLNNNQLSIENGTNHAKQGMVTFLWNDPNNEVKTLDDGTVLFELLFEKKGLCINEQIKLSNSITNIEAFDQDYQLHNIVLMPAKINAIEITKDTWDVVPNPATNGVIKVQMNLVKNKAIVFRLVDAKGTLMLERKVDATKGKNQFIIDQKTKLPTGNYYLQAFGIEGEEVKRIMIQ